jgi:hypothetical protein
VASSAAAATTSGSRDTAASAINTASEPMYQKGHHGAQQPAATAANLPVRGVGPVGDERVGEGGHPELDAD